MNKNLFTACGLAVMLALAAISCSRNEGTQQTLRPRTVVTTDGEVDDYDSFLRLLLYSNDMDIQAIVYSASQHHWAGDGQGTLLVPENRPARPAFGPMRQPQPEVSHRWIGTDWCQELIDAYAQCYGNLKKHDAAYPAPEHLRSIVKMGNIRVEGDMAVPTEGSDCIRDLLLDDDPRPLYLQIWGGTNTVARALLSIEEQYKGTPEWEAVYRKVSDKAVLHIIQDQDGTYRTYVEPHWPEIRTVYNRLQFFGFAYLWNTAVPEPLRVCMDGDWFRSRILEGHGPLAAKYMTLGSGYDLHDPDDHFGEPSALERPGARKYDFISEGDSPSYFLLMDFGLRSLEHPDWGGVGGRYVQEASRPAVWADPQLRGFNPFGRPGPGGAPQEQPNVSYDRNGGDFNPYTGTVDPFYPQTRWVEVLQNDFAARADWCVKDVASANHAPAASVKDRLDRTAKPAQKVRLRGAASDPDGNAVSLRWWQYREAGSYPGGVVLQEADSADAWFSVPEDAASGETIHLILEAVDDGTPALRHFQRVVVTVL